MERDRVPNVGAGNGAEKQFKVADGAGDEPDRLEIERHRREAVAARDAAVRGTQADEACIARGHAGRAAGVGANRERDHAGRDRRNRSAAGSAGREARVPRITGGPGDAVLGSP